MLDKKDFFLVGQVSALWGAEGSLEVELRVDGDWDRISTFYLTTDEESLMPYFVERIELVGRKLALRLLGIESQEVARFFLERFVYLSRALQDRFEPWKDDSKSV